MTHRLITAVSKADMHLKRALFPGNVNIFPHVQPKRLELRQYLSQLSSHPTKEFDKPFNQNNRNKSGACTAGGIGPDRQSFSLSGGADGGEGGEEKSKGGPKSDGKNKTRIYIGTASILGACWVYLNQKDLNWKGVVDNFFGMSTVECECALAIPDETLQTEPNAFYQEMTDSENEKESKSSVDLAHLVNAVNSTDPQIQYDAITSVRKLLSSDCNPPIESIDFLISCNILPTLVNCLSSQNPALQFEAAWALTNIAAGTSQQNQAVVEAGAVPNLLKLLTSPNQSICEHAVWALGNIIAHGPQLRDYVINLGFVAPLLNLIQPDIPITFLRNVTWVIANLCSYMDVPPQPQTLREILPALNVLVHFFDTTVLAETTWALQNLTEGGKDQIQMVIDSGVLPKLVQLLNHDDVKVQDPALRAVDNIVRHGTNDQVQAVLNCDALANFHNLLNHPNKNICEIALLTLAKVAASNFSRVQAIIDAGLVPLIIHNMQKGDFQTQKAAANALSWMISKGTKEQVEHLIDCGVIPLFTNLLNCKDSDVVWNVLVGIQCILVIFPLNQGSGDEACTFNIETNDQVQAVLNCDALSHFHNLLNHPNKKICKIALQILSKVAASNFSRVQAVIDAGLVPLIIHHLEKGDLQTQKAAANALSFMIWKGTKEQVEHLIDSGVIPLFTNLLKSEDSVVVSDVLVGIRNILAKLPVNQGSGDKPCTFNNGTNDQVQALLNCDALAHFHNLLNHPKKNICKGALLVLSKLARRNVAHVQSIIDAGLVPLIFNHMEKGEFQTQKAAAQALSSITFGGEKEQVTHLIDCGVIPLFCNLLNCKDSDVVLDVLFGIYNILVELSDDPDCEHKACTLIKECGGWDKIQTLQNHENMEISKNAHDISIIMEDYFLEDVEEKA